MATANPVRNAVTRQPFLIRLADGRTYEVKHPEFVAVSPPGRELLFVGDDQGIHQIDMNLVSEIETPRQTVQTKGSGE